MHWKASKLHRKILAQWYPTMKYKQAYTKKQEGTAMHRVKVKAISQNARVGMLA